MLLVIALWLAEKVRDTASHFFTPPQTEFRRNSTSSVNRPPPARFGALVGAAGFEPIRLNEARGYSPRENTLSLHLEDTYFLTAGLSFDAVFRGECSG
jgi:hypothetical protein